MDSSNDLSAGKSKSGATAAPGVQSYAEMGDERRIALVTGGTSGIGRATAHALAKQGMRVVIAGRDRKIADAVAEELRTSTGNADVETLEIDLGSIASVRAAAADYRARHDRLHVLVNCAGLSLARRETSADGFEMTFAVNHLGHFLLTQLLLDRLRASAPSRVVNVSSSGHAFGKIDFDNLQLERGYGGLKAYSQSKLANVLFTYELARRLDGSGVTVNSVHPGVVATPMNKRSRSIFLFRVSYWMFGWWWMRSPEKGAATVIQLASAPEVEKETGKYFASGRAVRSSERSHDLETAKKLWDVSVKLTGSDGAAAATG
jgi:NAD(P)-dependent dehydrogenase (short-subunit alcohol dehydrogenase family)